MKAKTIIFVAILIILTAIFVNNSSKEKKKEEFKPLEINVGDVFDEMDYGDTMYVLNYGIEDVTGDNQKDMILAIGNKESVDVPMAQKVDIVVYDKEKELFQKTNLKYFEGKNPRLIFADYTGDGINDILVSLDNDDNTKNIRIVELKDDGLKEIFNRRDNRGIIFVGEMVDGVKAHLRCGKYSKEMYLELIDMKELLRQAGIVDDSGRIVVTDKKVLTTSFTTIDNIALNNQTGIQTAQRIVTSSGNTILDEVTVIWKYENGKWQVVEAKGNRIGTL